MATPKSPSTPASQSAVSTPPTGTWRHPRLDEINRRTEASTFGEKGVRRLTWNISLLGFSFYVSSFIPDFVSRSQFFSAQSLPWLPWVLPAVRVLLLYNIVIAFLPLFRRSDDFSDIPLTPSQRALLGLPPSSTPATPGSEYVTPPRYKRSTPRTSSGSWARPGSASPVSGSPQPGSAGRERQSHSPFSPSASPLFQKAVGGDVTRRLSYGSSQGQLRGGFLGLDSSSSPGTPGTPTPSVNKGASVQLNSRWLYEKGRGSPGARSLY